MNKKLLSYFWVTVSVSIVFLVVYGFTNLHAETASKVYHFNFDWELGIPFVPSFIIIYFSLNLLFWTPLLWANAFEIQLLGKRMLFATLIAGLIFYFFPAPIAYERSKSVPGWEKVYEFLFYYDHRNNTLPSLHITYSLQTVFCVWKNLNKLQKNFMATWFLLICLSVLLTHQHHVLDIVAGVLLASLSVFLFKNTESSDVIS